MLVNSMTIWSMMKLLKIAWPSPFNQVLNFQAMMSCDPIWTEIGGNESEDQISSVA